MIFKFTILVCILSAALCQQAWLGSVENAQETPKPYEFSFKETNVNHTLTRQENSDPAGVVRGTYSYVDRNGAARMVNYIADINGFRASIVSNEPGLSSASPAGVTYTIQ